MSTILKALQRLEDEKSAGEDRSLNEQVVARRSRTAANGRWLAIAISLTGGIAVGSSVLYFWPGSGAPAPDLTSEVAPPLGASSASQSKPEPLAPELAPKPRAPAQAARARQPERATAGAVTPVSPVVEVVKRLEERPVAEPVLAEASGPEPDASGATRPAERRRAARQGATKRSGSTPTEQTKPRPGAAVSKRVPEPRVEVAPVVVAVADPTEATASTAAPAVEDAAVIPDPALGAAEPSQPVSASISPPKSPTSVKKVIRRAKIPQLSVGKTIWHPDVDRRLAIVELGESGEALRLKEGDAVGPLVIEAIRPGGVLFSHDGVEIEYRVGQ